MHEHKECQHELKYCTKCDVVYCDKCNKEWVKAFSLTSGPYINKPYITYTTEDTINSHAENILRKELV